jgi:hypothetical protein
MLADGLSPDKISDFLDLPLEDVKNLLTDSGK